MAVPYTFATATSAIPLSNLDSNFATAITLGSTALTLGTTTTTVAGLTLTSPTLTTPALGTPSGGVLTNCTGLPVSTGVSGLGTGVGTFLATPSSANLATAVTDETGSGSLVFATSPTLVTPILGTPTSGTLTNTTGFPAANLAGTALPSAIVTSSLTALGTIATGVWNGTAIGIAYGGTGQTTASAAFNALSPITTTGDLILGNGTNSATRLAIGANTYVLTSNGTTASWVAPSGGGGSQATATALGTVYALQTTGGGTPYLTAFGYNAGVSTTGTSNSAFGTQALYSNTTGTSNTAVGYQALYSNTTSNGNVAVGYQALYSSNHTSDTDNLSVAVGYQALYNATTAPANYAFGYQALLSVTTASANCAFGRSALFYTTGGQNCAFGYSAGRQQTSGTYSSFFGQEAAAGATITGSYNNCFGYQSGYSLTSGQYNTCLGLYSGYALTSGSQNVFVGNDSGRTGSPGGNFTTESNRIVLGNGSTTNAYIQVSWTVTSDARDKTDVVDSKYGLDFIKGLRPVEFKWDKRSNYFRQNPDGTHKEAKTQLGFLAQDVIALEKLHGGVAKDLLIADDEKEEEIVSITETKFIPVLVKALQELTVKFDQLKAEHDAYVASHP